MVSKTWSSVCSQITTLTAYSHNPPRTKEGDTLPQDGYIKLHRQITEWEWYTDAVTYRVFMHLLLNAAYKPLKWRGLDIEPGQVVTGLDKLASELCVSVRAIRTAIKHLETTGEMTSKTTNKGSVITLVNWAKYQSGTDVSDKQNDKQSDNTLTRQRQDNDKTTTTIKEIKKVIREEGISPTVVIGGSPLLTDQEQDTLGQAYRDNMAAVETQAHAMGMPFEQTDWMEAERLIAGFGADWLLEAMRRTATRSKGKREWPYIESILKNWKAGGGIDVNARPDSSGTKQGYRGNQANAGADDGRRELDITVI
jgi:DnaD/phage-associated family protein